MSVHVHVYRKDTDELIMCEIAKAQNHRPNTQHLWFDFSLCDIETAAVASSTWIAFSFLVINICTIFIHEHEAAPCTSLSVRCNVLKARQAGYIIMSSNVLAKSKLPFLSDNVDDRYCLSMVSSAPRVLCRLVLSRV